MVGVSMVVIFGEWLGHTGTGHWGYFWYLGNVLFVVYAVSMSSVCKYLSSCILRIYAIICVYFILQLKSGIQRLYKMECETFWQMSYLYRLQMGHLCLHMKLYDFSSFLKYKKQFWETKQYVNNLNNYENKYGKEKGLLHEKINPGVGVWSSKLSLCLQCQYPIWDTCPGWSSSDPALCL